MRVIGAALVVVLASVLFPTGAVAEQPQEVVFPSGTICQVTWEAPKGTINTYSVTGEVIARYNSSKGSWDKVSVGGPGVNPIAKDGSFQLIHCP